MSELAKHLNALVRDTTSPRTLNSVVRQELDTIMAARQAGHSYERICQALLAMGVKASPSSVRNAVYRIRRTTGAVDRTDGVMSAAKAATVETATNGSDCTGGANAADRPPASGLNSSAESTAAHPATVAGETAPPASASATTRLTPPVGRSTPVAAAEVVEAQTGFPPGAQPGFIRGILDEPCDLDELARQYRARSQERSSPSDQRPAQGRSQDR